jgi:hypothetical protein
MVEYWYKEFRTFCPPCGEIDSYKQRVEGKKPKNPRDRIETTTGMCYGCQYSMFGGI